MFAELVPLPERIEVVPLPEFLAIGDGDPGVGLAEEHLMERLDAAWSELAEMEIGPLKGGRIPDDTDLGPFFDTDPMPDGFCDDDIEAARLHWMYAYRAAWIRDVAPDMDLDQAVVNAREYYAAVGAATASDVVVPDTEQHHTDLGNARRLVEQHGEDLRFVPGIGWHAWDGTRWTEDADGEAVRRMKAVTDKLLDDARRLGEFNRDRAEARFKFGLRSQGAARIEAAVKLASTERAIVARVEDLDADSLLLNCANGTLDLRTGQLREHRRSDVLTKRTDITYSPTASCPRFQRYLADVTAGDAELARFIQRAVGYSLTGDTTEQCLFVLHGDGSNGKTTLLETVAFILGEYAGSADPASFTTAAGARSVRSDLARLRGARLVRAAEVERGAAFAESLIKQLTGGEPITAAFKFRDEFEFRPSFKLWIAANDLPAVLGDDYAIWRRLRVIPFDVRVDTPDKRLLSKLKSEAPGILAWAVRGTVDWRRDGLGECDAVKRATSAYGRDQDRVGAFLDECCQLGPYERIENSDLAAAFEAWETAHGREPLPDLHRRLDRRGIGKLRSHGKRYRTGLALRTTEGASDGP